MKKTVDYLRLSITDRCNLNCLYCTPLQKEEFLNHDDVLRYEEMVRLVRIFVESGIRKVRITGGEPLIKKNVVDLVKMLRSIKDLEEISMTTNGVYLKNIAGDLKEAGLERVNVSLDTLNRKKYNMLTGGDYFEEVFSGIMKALEVGFSPVKLNIVLMKGLNDDEIFDFVRLVFKYPISVRFIEFFQTSKRSGEFVSCTIRNSEVKEKIENSFGKMENFSDIKGNGPAEYYKLKDAKGTVGFISSSSKDFCSECNRVRVDCAGRVSPCLFSGYTFDFKPLLRSTRDDREITSQVNKLLKMKSGYNKRIKNSCGIEMSSIGG